MRLWPCQRVRGGIAGRQDQEDLRANADPGAAQTSQDNIDKEENVVALAKSISRAQGKAFAECRRIEDVQSKPLGIANASEENLANSYARGISNSAREKSTQSLTDPDAGGITNAAR